MKKMKKVSRMGEAGFKVTSDTAGATHVSTRRKREADKKKGERHI